MADILPKKTPLYINNIVIASSFYVRLVVDQIDVCDVIYVRVGPYLYKYFCLLHGPAVLLLMCCHIGNTFCLI